MKPKAHFLFLIALTAFPDGAAALSLTEYRELALRNNGSLRQARLAAEAADQTAKTALTNYFPKFSAAGLAARTNFFPASAIAEIPLIPVAAGAENDLALSMVSVQQPLFAGGRIIYGNRLARAGHNAAREQLRIKENEVAVTAEKKYRTLLILSAKKRTLAAYADLLNSLASQVEQAFARGLVTKTDVLRVNLKKSEVAINSAALEKAAILAEKDLRLYAGLENSTPLQAEDPKAQIAPPKETAQDLEGAAKSRPEYKLLEIGAKAAGLEAAMKRGEYLPSVAVGAALYRLDYFNGGADLRHQNSAAFGVVKMPLDFWGGWHAVKDLRLKERAAQTRLNEAGDYLRLDLEAKLNDYSATYDKVSLAELGLEEAKAVTSEKRDGYDNGTERLSDLLEAMAFEQQSADALEEAKAQYFEKRAAFLFAAGKSLSTGS